MDLQITCNTGFALLEMTMGPDLIFEPRTCRHLEMTLAEHVQGVQLCCGARHK